jgi:hypothetical protein
MADIDLTIGFSVEQASIRAIQRQVTQTFGSVRPEVDVQLAPGFLRELQQEFQTTPFTFEEFAVNPQSIANISRIINDRLTITIQEVDVPRRAIEGINRQIAEATRRLTVQGAIERQRDEGQGGRPGAVDPATRAQAAEAGIAAPAGITQILEQRERLEQELADLLARRALIERASLDAVNTEAQAIQQVVDIRQQLAQDLITARDAERQLAQLQPRGTPRGFEGNEEFQAQREIRTQALEAARAELEVAKERQANQQRAADLEQTALEVQQGLTSANRAKLTALRTDVDATQAGSQLVQDAKDALEKEIKNRQDLDDLTKSQVEAAKAVGKLAVIDSELSENIINLQTAKARAFRVQIDASTKAGKAAQQQKDQAIANLDSEIKKEETNKETIQKQKDANRALDREISAIESRLGITASQKEASKNLLEAMQEEAQILQLFPQDTRNALTRFTDGFVLLGREISNRLPGLFPPNQVDAVNQELDKVRVALGKNAQEFEGLATKAEVQENSLDKLNSLGVLNQAQFQEQVDLQSAISDTNQEILNNRQELANLTGRENQLANEALQLQRQGLRGGRPAGGPQLGGQVGQPGGSTITFRNANVSKSTKSTTA